jgi:hypothetical protein
MITAVCPVGTCIDPDACAERRSCILCPPPLILTPLSDWRANPYPYLLRQDSKPRAQFPQGVAHA